MTNIKGYYECGTFYDGNPPQLKNGMLLQGRHRNIRECLWSKYPKRLSVVEHMETDVYRGAFQFAVINSLGALEELLDDPCSTPTKYVKGISHPEVVNFEGNWLWDIIQWKRDGSWRSAMVVSFRTDADLVFATIKLRALEGLDVPPQAQLERHAKDFDNASNHLYKWRGTGKPTDAAPLFIC